MSARVDRAAVGAYLQQLQRNICRALEEHEDHARFEADDWDDPVRGRSQPRLLSGTVFERAAVNLTHSRGDGLPPAATRRRPELAGRAFTADSLSLIVHPSNPHVPTVHMNLRFFMADKPGEAPVWWFGGGFDLTPYYGYHEDAVHWHQNARAACAPFGDDVYPEFKQACDEYFYLKHRREARGIGGLFFDDLNRWDFPTCFAFMQSVGDAFVPGYLPLVTRRKDTPYGDGEREFQLLRRGRYVEFNLIYDRGTLYGLQSGRRVEAVLASLPPAVRWRYDFKPAPGSAEERLYREFLPARDWLGDASDA